MIHIQESVNISNYKTGKYNYKPGYNNQDVNYTVIWAATIQLPNKKKHVKTPGNSFNEGRV